MFSEFKKTVGLFCTMPFLVIQQGGPILDVNSCPHPFFGAFASDPAQLVGSLGEKHAAQWVNRCTEGPRCNPPINNLNLPQLNISNKYPSMRFRFSSTQKADACTFAQTKVIHGDLTDAYNISVMGGDYPLMPGVDLASYLDANGGTFLDACWLQGPSFANSGVFGLVYDFEVNDNRATDRTDIFAGAAVALAHSFGWQAWLYPLALTAPTAQSSGITAGNGPFLANLFDRVTISYQGSQADLDAQMAILGWPKNVVIDVSMTGTTCADFTIVRNYIVSHGLLGADAWPNGADMTYPSGPYYMQAQNLVEGCPAN